MSTLPKIDSSPSSLRAHISAGLRELTDKQGLQFLRKLAGAIFWQVLGKLIQVIGAAYAFRCLGPENVGISGTVIVVAGFCQLALDLGLDIVAVRHVAAKTAQLEEITPAMFSLRLILSLIAAAVWLAVIFLAPMGATAQWVWALGSPYLMVLVLNFSWFYQATERMPQVSMIQAATSLFISLYFLCVFLPGQAAGSDLLVMMLANGLVTTTVWGRIRRARKMQLVEQSSLSQAKALFSESRPNWCFNLSYYVLSSMSLPLCYFLLGERESGHFRAAAMIVASLQLVLSYFAFMLNPRIVAWRNTEPQRFRQRILLLVGALVGLGVLTFGLLLAVQRPVILLLYGSEFLPAAPLLAVLVFAKFLAVGSGILVWALFASKKDWLAVRCTLLPILIGFVLNCWLIPKYGIIAASWLNWLTELLLLGLCLAAFSRLNVSAEIDK